MQPKCPKHWDTGAWSKRYVGGISRYHVFIAGGPDREDYPMFVLKVSEKLGNGRRIYEDMSPMSSQLLEEMEEFTVRSNESVPKITAEDILKAEEVWERDTEMTVDETCLHRPDPSDRRDEGPLVELRDAVAPLEHDDS